MRKIYLVRHGEPDFPGGERLCIGIEDLPLSVYGEGQARKLARYFDSRPLSRVFCSELARSRRTAELMCEGRWTPEPIVELRELFAGEWEAKSMRDIKRDYVELFKVRGERPDKFAPPGGETLQEGLERFGAAFFSLVKSTQGDIAIVAHSGVNKILLTTLLGNHLRTVHDLPQPYAGINIIEFEDDKFRVAQIGTMSRRAPDRDECLHMMKNICQGIREHSLEVEKIALDLAGRFSLDTELISAAALLHDIAKPEKPHEKLGALRLQNAGYPDVARIIAAHHDIEQESLEVVTEMTIVYLADKLAGVGSLEERFEKSFARCKDESAREAHKKRFEEALCARTLIYN